MFDDQQMRKQFHQEEQQAHNQEKKNISASQTLSNIDEGKGGDGYKIVNVLSVCFIVAGMICFIVGWRLAAEHYRFEWMYFFSGILAMMFNFSNAVVMRVCALYMKMHDDF